MTKYSMKISDSKSTRVEMEQIVAAHGGITITDFKVGYLVVDAEPSVIDTFRAAHLNWTVNEVVYLDHGGPLALDYEAMRKSLDLKPGS